MNLADNAADSFISQYRQGKPTDLESIDLLCRMATSDDLNLAAHARSRLYGVVIEGLSDDFTPQGVEVCNKVLLKTLSFVREQPAGLELDQLLNELGYPGSEQLLDRYERNLQNKPIAASKKKSVKKIIVLSRVTIGADVAITGIMAWRLRKAFPNAELLLVGPAHLMEIFHRLPGSRIIEFEYKRHGSLLERFSFWPELYTLIRREIMGRLAGEVLFFDPDSRLSQLGLMPFLDDSSTYYFNSRARRPTGKDRSLSALVNDWLNEILIEQDYCFPQVSFSDKKIKICQEFCARLRSRGAKRIIAINFGVGEDNRKRIPDPFEELILASLLETSDSILLLDTGCSSEEKSRMAKLIKKINKRKISTAALSEEDFAGSKINFSHGAIAMQDSVGGFGAMVNEADLYLGYDSCFQHLANAVTTPAIIVFTGHPNERFIARWTPNNISANTKVIPVPDKSALNRDGIKLIARQVAQAIDKSFT